MKRMTVALLGAWVTAAGWPAPVLAVEAGSSSAGVRGQLIVRTYNTFGVAPRELGRARSTASEILRGAALDVVWHDCSRSERCGDRPGPDEVILQIVAARGDIAPQSLGYSLVDMQERGGSLATVLADRIETLAGSTRVDSGLLMGRAIAHELAHLLLGTNRHAMRGLMRARWAPDEIQADRRWDWVLSPEERSGIRQGLAARAHQLLAADAVGGGCVYPPPKPARPGAAPPPSAYPLCGG